MRKISTDCQILNQINVHKSMNPHPDHQMPMTGIQDHIPDPLNKLTMEQGECSNRHTEGWTKNPKTKTSMTNTFQRSRQEMDKLIQPCLPKHSTTSSASKNIKNRENYKLSISSEIMNNNISNSNNNNNNENDTHSTLTM